MDTYYSSDRCTVYLGDALDVLPALGSKSADLLATDPPYGVAWQSGTRKVPLRRLVNDDHGAEELAQAVMAESMPVLRPFRHAYIFGPFEPVTVAPDLTNLTELIWDKGQLNAGNLRIPWGPQHERITFGMRIPSKASRKRGDGRLSARLRQGSVLRVPRVNGTAAGRHPTEKPVALMRTLIEASSLPGETVLDPFLGAGATAVAAILSGRHAVGIELDEEYARTAVERIERAEALADQMESV